ncbi:MAG: hypothetical protein HN976_04770 [Lentisphaerae bacterium]|nr:hypothetical protein [Lentisphaerota bacterium]MBT7054382.1 hypothetical protein [Lentisphaerota bacterium]
MSTTSYQGTQLSTPLRALVRSALMSPLAASVAVLMIPLSGALAADAAPPVAQAKAALAQAEKTADDLADRMALASKAIQKAHKRFAKAEKAVGQWQAKLQDARDSFTRAQDSADKTAAGKELNEVTLRLQQEALERSTLQAELKRAEEHARGLSGQVATSRARVETLVKQLDAARHAEKQGRDAARIAAKQAVAERKRQEAEARKQADQEKARLAAEKRLAKERKREEAKRLAAQKEAAEAETDRLAEEKRAAADAEKRRQRELAKQQAEMARQAREAEEQRQAEQASAAKKAEKARKKQGALARKKAEEEQARLADQQRLAEEQAQAQAKRLAREQEAAQKAERERQRELAEQQEAAAEKLAKEQKAAQKAEAKRNRELAKQQEAAQKAEAERQRELTEQQEAAAEKLAKAQAAAQKAEAERQRQLAEQQEAEAKRIAKAKKAAEAAEAKRQRELAEQQEAMQRQARAEAKRRDAETRAAAEKAEAERKRLAKAKATEEKRQARLRVERENQILEAAETARKAADAATRDLASARNDASRLDQQAQQARQVSDQARQLIVQRSGELAAVKEDGWTKRRAAARLASAQKAAEKAAAKLQDVVADAGAAKKAVLEQEQAAASAAAALVQAGGGAASIISQREMAKKTEQERKLEEARREEQDRLAQIAARKAEQERKARAREEKRLTELAAEKAAAERKRLETEQQAAAEEAARVARDQQKAEKARMRAVKDAEEKKLEQARRLQVAAEKEAARAMRQSKEAEAKRLEEARKLQEAVTEKAARVARKAKEAEEERLDEERKQQVAIQKAAAKEAARVAREAEAAEKERLRIAREAEEKKLDEERQRQIAARKEADRVKAEAEKKIKAEERAAKRQAREERERLAAEQHQQEAAAKAAAVPPPLEPKHHEREESVTGPVPWTTKQVHEPPILPGDQRIEAPPAKTADIADTPKKLSFDLPMVSGDKDIVTKLDAWQEWADYVTFNPVTADEINEFHGKLVRALQEEGYAFADVKFPTRIWAYGIFLAKVDCGPLGTITVKGNRYYSAQQIIRALARQDADRFNHARIYGDIFDFDAKPDVRITATRLKPEIIKGRRVINAELEMADDLPIHAAVEMSNTGSKGTSKWRIKSTLQHVNLTKHDDVLTLNWITSNHLDVVNTFAGGYYLPIGERYSLSLYGGYSNSDIDDIAPQLDIRGSGHYFGGQVTKVLKDTPKAQLQLAGGWVFQHTETKHFVSGQDSEIGPKYELSTPRLTFEYASKTFDRLGGRNYFTNTLIANFADKFGSSEADEYTPANQGQATPGVDGDFLINRFTLARYQRFFRGDETPGKWSLFMKLDGQLASDSLVSAMRKSVGGAHSVRGYKENELSGDQALTATLELRTPLFHNFIPGMKKSDEYLQANPEAWQRHRLQFIAFTDMGITDLKAPLAGEQDGDEMMSAGLGLRLGFTKFSQMSVDYGVPINDATEETPSGGRAHLSLQLQF